MCVTKSKPKRIKKIYVFLFKKWFSIYLKKKTLLQSSPPLRDWKEKEVSNDFVFFIKRFHSLLFPSLFLYVKRVILALFSLKISFSNFFLVILKTLKRFFYYYFFRKITLIFQ